MQPRGCLLADRRHLKNTKHSSKYRQSKRGDFENYRFYENAHLDSLPGRKAILILINASLQSAKRYLAFLWQILTTPKRRWPDVRRAIFTYFNSNKTVLTYAGTHYSKAKQQQHCKLTFGEMMLSTLLSRLHSKTCALVSFLSQWAASQILASGPRLLRTKWA